jgi:hypothetical protein
MHMMKVKNTLIFIVVLSSATLYAQNTIRVEPFLAIEGSHFPSTITLGDYSYKGAEASTIDFPSPTQRGSSTGLYASSGKMFEYSLTRRVSLRTGIAYANRHFTAKRIGSCTECTSTPIETMFRLSYTDIPVLARYYFLAKRVTLYADAGITTSARIHNETVVIQVSSRRDNIHIADAPMHEIMLMAQFGMGAAVRFKRAGISLSGIYRNGITKFATTDNYRFKALGANAALFFIIGDIQ